MPLAAAIAGGGVQHPAHLKISGGVAKVLVMVLSTRDSGHEKGSDDEATERQGGLSNGAPLLDGCLWRGVSS